MAESALNQRLMKALKPFDPVRVENAACAGTPDINCTLGWIENKYLDHWPKDESLVVKCDHYTAQQRVWAVKRNRAGGKVWFMLQVGREYLLFRGEVAAEHFGRVDKSFLRGVARHSWHGHIDDGELRAILLGD